MKRLLLLAFVASLLAACSGKPSPPPIVVQPNDTADCGAACDHLNKLGCEQGKSFKALDAQGKEITVTCKMFCEQTQKQGHALSPSCVLTILTCAEIEKCDTPRQMVPPTE